MTDAEPAPTPPPPPLVQGTTDDKTLALTIYILYLAAFVVGVTGIVGLILAYVNKDTAPEWLKSHYVFQIRTFWIGLLFSAIGCVLVMAFGLGFLILGATAIWFIVRCALGINQLMKNEAYPRPESWTV